MYYWCAFNLVIILNGFVGQPKECPKWAWGLNIIRIEISLWMHTRCVLFSLPMQIDAWETYSDFVRNDHYTRTLRYCETVTYNCVLKRSETLFKGRYRHSFREIDNTKLHNTYNLFVHHVEEFVVGNGLKGSWEKVLFKKKKNIQYYILSVWRNSWKVG